MVKRRFKRSLISFKMRKPALDFKNSTLFLAAATLVLVFILGQWGTTQFATRQLLLTELARREQLPRLTEGVARPHLSAKAVYAIDVASGKPLFAKNEEVPLLPASTTKLATALISLEGYNLQDILTVGELEVEGQVMELVPDEQISVSSLLYGLLLFSANDAAEVLAQNFSGGRENFILDMNKLAESLGLEDTNFVNPTGLDEYLHFSTAKDLVLLALYATQNQTIAEIVKTPKIEVSSVDGKVVHELVNLNQLVGKVPGVLGVKTGWTENSAESLITLVEREGNSVIIAVLGSPDRFGETEELIDWIYQNYSWE